MNWLTPEQMQWAGLALFITGCFIAAQIFCAFYRRWRAAGQEEEPCAQCQPGGKPPCVCKANCGSDRCAKGHHTTLDMFTPEDMKILRGIEQAGVPPRPRRPWHRGRKPVKR